MQSFSTAVPGLSAGKVRLLDEDSNRLARDAGPRCPDIRESDGAGWRVQISGSP